MLGEPYGKSSFMERIFKKYNPAKTIKKTKELRYILQLIERMDLAFTVGQTGGKKAQTNHFLSFLCVLQLCHWFFRLV
jgi:hypothetical protein